MIFETVKLSEVADIIVGFAFKSQDFNTDGNGVRLVRGKNITKRSLRWGEDTRWWSDFSIDLSRYFLKENDIVIGMDGSLVGKNYAKITESDLPLLLVQRVACIRAKKGISQEYLWQIIATPVFEKYIDAVKTGTTIPHISGKQIGEYEIPYVDYETQLKISGILSSIEERVLLNTAINENLEQQAQALFKAWFVDFVPFDEKMVESPIGTLIPASLKMVQIADIPHDLETGKRPKGGAVADGIPSVGAENVKKLGDFNPSSAKYIPFEFAEKMKKGEIKGYEVLLYKDGGKPGTFIPHFSMFGEGFPYSEFYINEHVFKLDFYDRGFNEFMYFYLQTDYPYNWLANNGGKAAVPGINQQDVNTIWCFSPEHPMIQEYCKWVQPIFTTILKNCTQNMELAALRDTLLPKLMNGEIDVSDVKI